MAGDGLFHLELDPAVLRVHIVEDLLAGGAVVRLDLIIKVLVDVLERPLLGHLEPQVVERGIPVIHIHPGDGLAERIRPVEEHGAEVKVIPE